MRLPFAHKFAQYASPRSKSLRFAEKVAHAEATH